MFVVKNRKIFFGISGLLVAFSIFSMIYFGFNFGIDFRGGSILEVSYSTERPNIEAVRENLNKLDLGNYSIRPSEKGFVVRAIDISPDKKTEILQALTTGESTPKEERFNSIGPAVGNELKNKAYIAIAVVILCIVIFITFVFRKVSEPVPSWKYGLTTILTLIHDVIVPTGIFVAIASFTGAEIDLLFVSAILAVLGYSVHDTIVVFDRIRENLKRNKDTKQRETFEETVGKGVSQTFVRSINTSLTTFLVLLTLYFMGSDSTKNFSLVLLLGIVAGAYSSIFFAAPFLLVLEKLQRKN